jgi:hypothetical protein
MSAMQEDMFRDSLVEIVPPESIISDPVGIKVCLASISLECFPHY